MSVRPEDSRTRVVEVGDVWSDKQALANGYPRTVMVKALSASGDFAFVVASPSGRYSRIHRQTLTRRFTLKARMSDAVTRAAQAALPGGAPAEETTGGDG